MNELSKGKLEFFKFRKKYTNLKISELTGIPISSIDKIFSGNNKNPTLETITKIAQVLECSVDDFIDNNTSLSPYYSNKELAKTARNIHDNPNLKMLYENASQLDDNDLEAINYIIKRMQN